jgi:hypothetical protein
LKTPSVTTLNLYSYILDFQFLSRALARGMDGQSNATQGKGKAMGMQKYRADTARKESDGAVAWHAQWMGGATLSRVNACRIDGVDYRLTVYATGEPDTYFSQPAATRRRGRYIAGYLTRDESGYVFHAMDRHKARLT